MSPAKISSMMMVAPPEPPVPPPGAQRKVVREHAAAASVNRGREVKEVVVEGLSSNRITFCGASGDGTDGRASRVKSAARSLATTAWTAPALALALAATALAGPATFPECTDPDRKAGDCLTETPGIGGCDDPDCCATVCLAIEECCTEEWGLDCTVAAEDMCVQPPLCPGVGSCFEPQITPSCEDVACCELICRIDGFCCGAVWDALCAQEAEALCGLPACALPQPPAATIEPELCGERLNDGCNLDPIGFTPIACSQSYYGTVFAYPPRDTDWYRITVPTQRTLNWTVASEFPAALLIMKGQCDPAIEIVAAGTSQSCQASTVSVCVEPGTYYLFVASGSPAKPIYTDLPCAEDAKKDPKFEPGFYGSNYVATLTCEGCDTCAGPADLNCDGVVNGFDLALLLGAWTGAATYSPCPPIVPADLNGDCRINGFDLAILLGAWG